MVDLGQPRRCDQHRSTIAKTRDASRTMTHWMHGLHGGEPAPMPAAGQHAPDAGEGMSMAVS